MWDEITYPFTSFNDWSLGIVKKCYPTLYNGCNYLSMLGLRLIHVNKRISWYLTATKQTKAWTLNISVWGVYFFNCMYIHLQNVTTAAYDFLITSSQWYMEMLFCGRESVRGLFLCPGCIWHKANLRFWYRWTALERLTCHDNLRLICMI